MLLEGRSTCAEGGRSKAHGRVHAALGEVLLGDGRASSARVPLSTGGDEANLIRRLAKRADGNRKLSARSVCETQAPGRLQPGRSESSHQQKL